MSIQHHRKNANGSVKSIASQFDRAFEQIEALQRLLVENIKRQDRSAFSDEERATIGEVLEVGQLREINAYWENS